MITHTNSPHAIAMTPFIYSGKIIILASDYEIKKNVNIHHVKKLSAKSQWYKKPGKDEVFQYRTLNSLKGNAGTTMKKLNTAGIMTCYVTCSMMVLNL